MDNDNSSARLYYLFGTTQQLRRSSWLARLPVGLFGISVGMFSLVGAWRRAASYGWDTAASIADFLIWPVTAIWLVSLLLYACKYKRHPQVVMRESRHPVQGSLQALLPLSGLLAIIQFHQPDQGVWLVLALLALSLHAVIAFRVISALATGQMPANAMTPALYLPVVGGALVGGMTIAALGYSGWAALLFGLGLLGWGLLEARILHRLLNEPMPAALRPTIGIELAPSIITTLTAATIWPQLSAEILMIGLGVAAAPFIGVMARYRWWYQVPFSIGFWSFSFPVAALSGTVIEVVHRGGWPSWIGIAALLVASMVIAFLILRTAMLLVQRRFLPSE